MLAVLDRRSRPVVTVRDLTRRLGGGRGLTRAVRGVLRELVRSGRVDRLDEGYRMARADGLVEGVLRRAGDGAQQPGEGPDREAGGFFVMDDAATRWQVSDAAGATPGDRVLLQPRRRGRARGAVTEETAGEIVQIVGGPRREWVGIVVRARRGHALVPYRDEREAGDWSHPIAKRDLGGARDGEVVVARPVDEGRAGRGAALRVVEVLGEPGDAEADFRAIAWRRRLPIAFAARALEEADAMPAQIPAAELRRRLDLRDRCFVTIDPETARDHDDAVFVEPRAGANGAGGADRGDRLWVAIADVSHFVRPGTALDHEAFLRGNSVYFPSRAIPMLPERLSGDLCSLRPDTDRLVLAVEIELDAGGGVVRSRLHEAVMRSHARLSYPQAARVIDPDALAAGGGAQPGPAIADAAVHEQLERLGALARRLLRRRIEGGSLDFELPEAQVVMGADGRPKDVVRGARTFAHRAIEEAMLAANREVARALLRADRGAVFRVHEPPSPGDLDALHRLYAGLDLLEGRVARLDGRAIGRALRRAVGRPAERLVHMLSLRAMKQAHYAAENLGHFALAFDAYLHFTSPIRRYADLVVHRAVRGLLRGVPPAEAERPERLERIAIQTSARERVAMAAERESIDLARAAVMRDRVGEIFEGHVTNASPHGLFVGLESPFVEGLVRISDLPGWYDFDADRHALVGRESGRRFTLGDAVRVRLVKVDPVRGWIDFRLEGAGAGPSTRSGRPARPARRSGAPTRRRDRR